MFGVGTDYCLLLVSRYREELRRTEDKHAAMARAVHRAGPAIFASGLTVAVSMLVLLVAQLGSTKTLGAVAAIGVACTMVAALTLLPALLISSARVASGHGARPWPATPPRSAPSARASGGASVSASFAVRRLRRRAR